MSVSKIYQILSDMISEVKARSSQKSRPKTEEQPLKEMTRSLAHPHGDGRDGRDGRDGHGMPWLEPG